MTSIWWPLAANLGRHAIRRDNVHGASVHRLSAIISVLGLSVACHSPIPPPATAPQLATYVGCFDITVTTDSASVPTDSMPPGARRPVEVSPQDREERFWVYLSPQEIQVEGGAERGLLAVRPRLDPTEASAWRMLGADTVVVWFDGYGTWQQVFRLRGSRDTLSGLAEYRSHIGYRSYSEVTASRRACPADSLSAADTLVDWPDETT